MDSQLSGPTSQSTPLRGIQIRFTPAEDGLFNEAEKVFIQRGIFPGKDFVPRMLAEARAVLREVGDSRMQSLFVIERETSRGQKFPHTLITATDDQENPVMMAMITRKPFVIHTMALDKTYPRACQKEAYLSVMDCIDAIGRSLEKEWIVAEESSPEARKALIKRLRLAGKYAYNRFYTGTWDKAKGVWHPNLEALPVYAWETGD